jgi:DNA-binding Xre family transcriptional regulator
MARKLDYRWQLRTVMAMRGMFATTELIGPLAERGIHLSSSQVYRLVVDKPERLSLKVLMALLDILDCQTQELIEPVSAGSTARASKRAALGSAAVGSLRPRSARIMPRNNG